MKPEFWKDRPVLVTGHTGFKGSWLCLWLADMGARVHGFALDPPTTPSLFDVSKVAQRLQSDTRGDVREANAVSRAVERAQAEVVFHLAAQPLVRHSYSAPVETYATNVMGTAHLLEAVRTAPSVKAVVNVTTDKCYENREWIWPYREDEALGGYDPYSSSKACSELVTAAYRNSFLKAKGVHVASARAGNVIGGGDWAQDRLIPDFLRALGRGEKVRLRSPFAVRPWQHVLEPLCGYLELAEQLFKRGDELASAFNFGPNDADARPVVWVIQQLCAGVEGSSYEVDGLAHAHEAHLLKLDSSKAKAMLAWQPRWSLKVALAHTLSWHQGYVQGRDAAEMCSAQIREYQKELLS